MSEVLIAKSFHDSAARLELTDRGRVFDFLTKFAADPTNPGISFERVDRSPDPNLWSARITQGLRAIVHKAGSRFLLVYAGRHDDAYRWAERRRVSEHPVTHVVQIVESSEEVEKQLAAAPARDASLFPVDVYDDAYLLSLGTPPDWLPALRMIRNDDQLLDVASKLPEEVAERLIALSQGETVTPPPPARPSAPLPEMPDAQRRFYVVQDASDLADVLNQPLDAWIRFLHPTQRALVEGSFRGPAKVTGSAGTGKTVVAMHRARELARRGHRVLLTSFVRTLCENIEQNLAVLCRPEERDRIAVATVDHTALTLARQLDLRLEPAKDDEVERLVKRHRVLAPEFDERFVLGEWEHVIDLQGLASWDAYCGASRRGRGRPLAVPQRQRLWAVFERVREDLAASHHDTFSGICQRAAVAVASGRIASPYECVVVDEVQDLRPTAIRMLAALARAEHDALMLIGDAGQRIYPGGFSLRELGIDVRGRSKVLRLNYRTTEQIRRAADRVSGPSVEDLDSGEESRRGTVSLLRGPDPLLCGFTNEAEEAAFVAERIAALVAQGLAPGEIAVFARAGRVLDPVSRALEARGMRCVDLKDAGTASDPGAVRTGTMHRAKGLEFKAVFAFGCSSRALPDPRALRKAQDPADREAALACERHLLYVSMTRARDETTVTWSGEPSQFLAPLLARQVVAAGGT